MALALSTTVKLLEDKLLSLTISCMSVRERHKLNPPPKLRNPTWFTQKNRVSFTDPLTTENQEFLKEVVQDQCNNISSEKPKDLDVVWRPGLQRTGVIARKIGIYPMWLKNGKKISTTLLQVLDNQVIKYYTPESYNPPRPRAGRVSNRKGCLLLGAEQGDPSEFTREYCGIFKDSGVIPKKTLARFFVSPDAALPPGTSISALHFCVGNYVDVRGLTIDRGFQGVMKRHGFKGMPASHGVTKTHRRGGNIGGGGEKGRVWPGTKMPGHMGNRYRILRALKIWRINTKYNVLYVSGQNIPGATNSIVYIYDTKVVTKRHTEPVPFPTYWGGEEVPENIYDKELHEFGEPSIVFKEQ
ncbi:large ribosomal subunit protein uL3m [Tribolium castaneum]|uniref:Large ribosomal subunit protein uL3m n=1 Tax=Tribolium castaneum TaxID=7070 RepID=D6WL81_TRICA|nr:PREDICTED: 39S ribosomal protein L3, mitochondrial [Tribolium castaneum]EFA04077.1 39S ribosomal protein L3, mitochondrial-like Protein [Tribolium castaneum]|eukprot:XP_973661.1 PREDICTED: 39S ribosomal protein L3, mitochondrial [Tribolium castaneum]